MKIVDRSNMKVFVVSVLVIAVLAPLVKTQSNLIQGSSVCSSEESTEEDDKILAECSAEVESTIIMGLNKGTAITMAGNLRRKRELVDSPAERRISGCLLQCIFRKYSILGDDNLPTRRGLLSMITEDVTDRGFYLAAHRIADHCFSKVREFRDHHRIRSATGGEICDLAYDVFSCYAEEMDDYCNGKN